MTRFAIATDEPQFSGKVLRVFKFWGVHGDMMGKPFMNWSGCSSIDKAEKFPSREWAEAAADHAQRFFVNTVFVVEVQS